MVKLKGKISYEIGKPGTFKATPLEPLSVSPIPRLINEDKTITLESTYPLDQFKGLAKFQTEQEFLVWLVTVFGADIPLDAYKTLRRDLIGGALTMPPIKVLLHGLGDHPGSYDTERYEIHVSSKFLQEAIQVPAKRATLFVVLNHEFGHHIDNLLRTRYSTVGGDSKGEEGSRFAYNLANLKFDIQSKTQFATYTSDELGSGSLIVEYAEAHRIARQYADNDQYEEHDGSTEMFGSGRGQCIDIGGCYGHESIEDVLGGITDAKSFNEKDRLRIYFGNWLRDNSQLVSPALVRPKGSKSLVDGFSRQTLTAVVQVMAAMKFGNDPAFSVTEERLGLYRAEEHLDNPKGIEDERAKDAQFRCAYDPREGEIDRNGFKNYIGSYSPEPTAWQYLTGQLTLALQLGRTDDGMRHFGQALHIYEDIFAHSNLCEIALAKLGHDVELWVPKPKPLLGRIPLVSGAFGGADTAASLLLEIGETLQKKAQGFPGEVDSEKKVALLLINDRYPHQALGQRILASTKETGGDIGKFYRYIYGSLAKYIAMVIGWLLINRAERIKTIQNNNRDPNSTDPTHTQMAKDHTTHPLHILAADMARHAVFELGTAMAKAWENKATLEEVIAVAEKHWDHPQETLWMDRMVSEWAEKNPEKIKQAASREYLEERAKALHADFEKRTRRIFPQYAKAESLLDEILKE